MQTKERQSASLVKKFSSFTRAASAGVPEAELYGYLHKSINMETNVSSDVYANG